MLDDLFAKHLTPEIVLDALRDRGGADDGITARELVQLICGVSTALGERQLRHVIQALRMAGHAVGGTPSTGYFFALTDAELTSSCEFLFSRAMTSLAQVAAMRRVALPDLRGQLRLPIATGASNDEIRAE